MDMLELLKKLYQSLPKNIDNFDKIDIFIHTWDTIDRLTNSYYSSSLDKQKYKYQFNKRNL